jgi:hypothetical protein
MFSMLDCVDQTRAAILLGLIGSISDPPWFELALVQPTLAKSPRHEQGLSTTPEERVGAHRGTIEVPPNGPSVTRVGTTEPRALECDTLHTASPRACCGCSGGGGRGIGCHLPPFLILASVPRALGSEIPWSTRLDVQCPDSRTQRCHRIPRPYLGRESCESSHDDRGNVQTCLEGVGLDAVVIGVVGVTKIACRGSAPLHPSAGFVSTPDDEREGGYDGKLSR